MRGWHPRASTRNTSQGDRRQLCDQEDRLGFAFLPTGPNAASRPIGSTARTASWMAPTRRALSNVEPDARLVVRFSSESWLRHGLAASGMIGCEVGRRPRPPCSRPRLNRAYTPEFPGARLPCSGASRARDNSGDFGSTEPRPCPADRSAAARLGASAGSRAEGTFRDEGRTGAAVPQVGGRVAPSPRPGGSGKAARRGPERLRLTEYRRGSSPAPGTEATARRTRARFAKARSFGGRS